MASQMPAERAQRKSESRHNVFFYPLRCELEGCSAEGDFKRCSACKMVNYCCQEHQREDWPLHKEECKLFKRLGLSAVFYTDADMLRRYPLKPPRYNPRGGGDPPRAEPLPAGAKCALCGAAAPATPMTRTECCGQPVCDTSDDYVMMSYSREFCERSHDRYTLCGYHCQEEECDAAKDWRECPKYHCQEEECAAAKDWRECAKCTTAADANSLADTLWRGLNSYNYCPLLTASVPRHARCERCAVCRRLFMSGLEGASANARGLTCLQCCGM